MEWEIHDVFLLVITLIMILTLVGVVVVGVRLMRVAEEFGRAAATFHELRPRLERTLDDADQELQQIRELNESVNGVVADVRSVTAEASDLAVRSLEAIDAIRLPDRYRALVAGARAGYEVLKHASRDA